MGDSLFWQDMRAVLSRPAIGLGGATLLLAWVLYRGVTWAAASAESLVEEKTAPETAKQVSCFVSYGLNALSCPSLCRASLRKTTAEPVARLLRPEIICPFSPQVVCC